MIAVRHNKLGGVRGGARGMDSAMGMTLIELIVVLAIIALLAGIAIPTLVRTGAFAKNSQPDSARQLLGLLKAARSYSATHRVDTAVVYTLKLAEDTQTNANVEFVYALAVARRVASGEFPGLGDDAFVPIKAEEAQFRKLAPGTCIRNMVAAWSEYNVYGIELHDVDSVDFPPPLIKAVVPFDGSDFLFPAHVFRSNGMLRGAEASSRRIEMHVDMAPTAPVEDRFTDDDFTVDVESIVVELYPVTGRVKIRES